MANAADTRKLDLVATLAEAVRRLPTMWRGAGGVLALAAALTLAALFAPGEGSMRVAVWAAAVAAALAAFGAITRIGLASDGARVAGLGPFGLQLGKVEARLAGAVLLCALFLSIILSLLALVALALFGGAGLDAEAIRARDWAAAGAAWKLALLAGVGVVVLGTPVLLAVRLSLFAQATVAEGRMISLTATRLTNGAILPLLGGLVVVQAPGLLWTLFALSGVLSVTAALVGGIVLIALVQIPLQAAFLGAAYRRLQAPQDDLAPL